MKKMYLALALVFVGCAASVSAQNNIADYISVKYCSN